MRGGWMVVVDDIEQDLLGPGMPVEAGADELAVFVPAVTGVCGRMDRHYGESTGPYAIEQRGPQLHAPRCLADREQGNDTSGGDLAHIKLADVGDAARAQPGQLGALVHASRGLVENAVHARGTVTVRRDLCHEQETRAHWAPMKASFRRVASAAAGVMLAQSPLPQARMAARQGTWLGLRSVLGR